MKTNFTLRRLTPLLTLVALLFSIHAYAQPANDNCSTATEITLAADEASCVPVTGNTVGATQSNTPTSVCSGSWFADDIWFKFTTGATIPDGSVVIKTEFGSVSGDVPAVGMAIYESCGMSEIPLSCFSSAEPEDNSLLVFSGSLMPNHTYYVRIWSGVSPNANSGTFRVCAYYNPPSTDVVLWDGGQFDGGLGDWTTVGITSDTAVWTWKDCSCSAGMWRQTVISSPTAFNGAMVFDSDLLNYNVTGSPPYPFHEGELISPIIDCSTFDAVSIKYYQSYDALNGNTYYSYSLDGGNTWVDPIEVNADIAANTGTPKPSVMRHYISEAAGVSEFRFKFIYDADYYNWIIDDVQLIQPERNNLVVMENFYAIAPNAMTPSSQVGAFSFLADVANIGAEPQTNVNLNVSIIDSFDLQQVFTADLTYGTIPADTLIENIPFTAYFTPDGSVTTYTGTYEISSDSVDFDPSNNFRRFNFMTTDTTFANEFGADQTIQPAASNWEGEGEPHSWAFGNYFYVVDGSPNWYASSATFGLGNADDPGIAGRLISIYLYKWDSDANEDGNMDPDERTRVGFNVYEILGTEATSDLITVPLNNFPSGEPGPVALESGQAYVLMVEYATNDIVDFALVAGLINFDAMTFRSELDGIPAGNARYAYMLGVNGDLESEPYSSAGFVTRMAPVVRLNITQPVKVDETLDLGNIIEISPNPADKKINLKVDLVEAQDQVNIRILDINGRLILDQPYDNVKNEMLQFDVSNYASGTYFLHFITEIGVRTERFIVQH